MPGVDRIRTQPLGHGAMQQHLELAAMDRELRPVVARRQPARFMPDALAQLVVVGERRGLDRDPGQRVAQAELGQDAYRVRQQVDAHAEGAQRFAGFPDFGVDAVAVAQQCQRQPADAAAGDCDLHVVSPLAAHRCAPGRRILLLSITIRVRWARRGNTPEAACPGSGKTRPQPAAAPSGLAACFSDGTGKTMSYSQLYTSA
ncbi:hypothetical protein D9M72_387770 [compost metagenome]